ncbi:hypothetical protein [Sinomonas sp. P10A9]|uniref:Uncharacterized protein n=1 Tax=Sinomonas puerhi TaxID=3238584 RepID=A0AB39L7U1_9MICC
MNPDPKDWALTAQRHENMLAAGLFHGEVRQRDLLHALDDMAHEQPAELREAYLLRIAATAITFEAAVLRTLGEEGGTAWLEEKGRSLELLAPHVRFEPPPDDVDDEDEP